MSSVEASSGRMRNILRNISKSVRAVPLFRRSFRNWIAVLGQILNRSPTKRVVIRCGNIVLEGQLFNKNDLFVLADLLDNNFRVIPFGPNSLLVQSPEGITIRVRVGRGADLAHIREVFLLRVYGDKFADKVVFDVGMSNGDSSLFFAHMGARLVLGFEPYKESYELAVENIRRNSMESRVIPLNLAVSGTTGVGTLTVSSGFPNVNSLNPTDTIKDFVEFDHFERINTVLLEDIMDKYEIEKIDFLKMDCEGCEYTVIRSLSPERLRAIYEIYLEFHSGPEMLIKELQTNGFELRYERDKKLGYLVAKRYPELGSKSFSSYASGG